MTGQKFIISFFAVFVLMVFSASSFGVAEKVRVFEFNYELVLEKIPKNSSKINIWIPYLPEKSYQILEEVKFFSDNSADITHDEVYHNKVLHYSLDPEKVSSFQAKITYKIKRYEFSKRSAVASSQLETEEELSKYLKSSRLVTLSPQVRALADEIVEGKETVLEKARAIYDYVFDNVKYDKVVPGWGRGDTERVCLVGAGNCTDFHSLFISLARADGIPAKFVIGFPLSKASAGQIMGYHCWAEFYDQKLGWVPVDISEAWKNKAKKDYYFGTIGESRLEFTQGRDIILGPEHKGKPLNYFIYPYIEIDGKPFKDFGISFSFKDVEI